MEKTRIEPGTGLFQKESFWGWTDLYETPERINPTTGVHEIESYGILGSSWVPKNPDNMIRINRTNGEVEKYTEGLFGGSWGPSDSPHPLN